MSSTGPFGFEDGGLSGVYVVAVREPLLPCCVSEHEIDLGIKDLKENLDQLAGQMKLAIRKAKDRPIL